MLGHSGAKVSSFHIAAQMKRGILERANYNEGGLYDDKREEGHRDKRNRYARI